MTLSMSVWSMPCPTCSKRCFSSQHLCRDPVVDASDTTLFTRRFMYIIYNNHRRYIHKRRKVDSSLQYVFPRRQQWNACQTTQSISRSTRPPTVTWPPSHFQVDSSCRRVMFTWRPDATKRDARSLLPCTSIYIYTTLFAKIGSRIKTEERKTLTNN